MRVGIHLEGLRGGHKIRGIGVHTSELFSAISKLKNKNIKVEEYGPRRKYGLVHYTVFNPFVISLPFVKPAKKVVLTIHDLIPLIYPKHYPGGLRGNLRFALNKFLIRKNVDSIITISQTSKKDICRFLGVAPERVHVIYLAPREIFKKLPDNSQLTGVKNKYHLPEKFALYVGDINYNKNIPNLVKASRLAKLPLVICGKQAQDIEDYGIDLSTLAGPKDYIRYLFGRPHPELAHYEELANEFKDANVIRLGYVSDEDLVKIYNLADVYIQPSFYEGFGLPVLEAVACDCPVVAAKTQALVEILGKAATYVDPKNPESIARGMGSLVKNRKLPRKYSWEKTAAETLKIYAQI